MTPFESLENIVFGQPAYEGAPCTIGDLQKMKVAWAADLDELARVKAELTALLAAREGYKPQVIQFDEAMFTEIVLEDVEYIVGSQIWCEPIYKMSDRTLIGFRAWTKDLKLPAPQEKA